MTPKTVEEKHGLLSDGLSIVMANYVGCQPEVYNSAGDDDDDNIYTLNVFA